MTIWVGTPPTWPEAKEERAGGGDGGATARLVVDKEGIDGAIFSLYVITSQVSLF